MAANVEAEKAEKCRVGSCQDWPIHTKRFEIIDESMTTTLLIKRLSVVLCVMAVRSQSMTSSYDKLN